MSRRVIRDTTEGEVKTLISDGVVRSGEPFIPATDIPKLSTDPDPSTGIDVWFNYVEEKLKIRMPDGTIYVIIATEEGGGETTYGG